MIILTPQVAALKAKNEASHAAFLEQSTLAEEMKSELVEHQRLSLENSAKTEILQHENSLREQETARLRQSRAEQEMRVQNLEDERGYYHHQLAQMGAAQQVQMQPRAPAAGAVYTYSSYGSSPTHPMHQGYAYGVRPYPRAVALNPLRRGSPVRDSGT